VLAAPRPRDRGWRRRRRGPGPCRAGWRSRPSHPCRCPGAAVSGCSSTSGRARGCAVGDVAVLGLAEVQRLRAGQHQREASARSGRDRGLVAGSSNRREPAGIAVGERTPRTTARPSRSRVGTRRGCRRRKQRVLAVPGLQRQRTPPGSLAQLRQRDATRRQLVLPGRRRCRRRRSARRARGGSARSKMISQVGPGLAARLRHRRARAGPAPGLPG
jgi:hypothetical protein